MADASKLYALLIGINDYDSQSLRSLQYAVADVLAFRDLLGERMGLDPDCCLTLTSSLGGVSRGAKRADLLSALDRFATQPMQPEDLFVFYFAGHGFALEGETFLMATDSQPGSKSLLSDTGVSLENSLKKYLRGIRAGHQLLILDACRNNPRPARGSSLIAFDSSMTKDLRGLASEAAGTTGGRAGRTVISACWEGQVSYEFPAQRHGWFSWHLLESIRAHRSGPLPITPDWVKQVAQRMKSAAPLQLPDAAEQEPHPLIEGDPILLPIRVRRVEDPAQVQVKEVAIQPLTVEVERVAKEQVELEGLPPIPGDILELEGLLDGLQQAIRDLENGSHPALKPAQAALDEAEAQWRELSQDLEEDRTVVPAEAKARLIAAVAENPTGDARPLLKLARESGAKVAPSYVHRLRNVERARRIKESAARQFAQARQNELEKLRIRLAEAEARLGERQDQDFDQLLADFLPGVADEDDFLAAWSPFEAQLALRRYRLDLGSLYERADQRFQALRDDRAWRAASAAATIAAVETYLGERPQGAHAAEARSLLQQLKDDAAWMSASLGPTESGLEAYLKDWPQGTHVPEARQMLEQLRRRAWQTAQAAGTEEALETFLKEHPASPHAPEATALLEQKREERAWSAATTENKPSAYRRYLREHPCGKHAPEAKAWLERNQRDARRRWLRLALRFALPVAGLGLAVWLWTAWSASSLRQAGTALAAKSYPEAARLLHRFWLAPWHGAEAARLRADLDSADEQAWLTAKGAATELALGGYLRLFPGGRHAAEASAKGQHDDAAWKVAEQAATEAAYQSYLTNWLNGHHVTEAKNRLAAIQQKNRDDAAWNQVRQAATVAGVESYLASHPKGAHEAEARELLKKLQTEETARQDDSAWQAAESATTEAAYQNYVSKWPSGRHLADAKKQMDALQQKRLDDAA